MNFKVGDRIVYPSRSKEPNSGVVVETRYTRSSQVQWDHIKYKVPYENGSGDCHTISNDDLEFDETHDSPLCKALR